MAWVDLQPQYASRFRQSGWGSASSFLAWDGILVNRHRHRQVEWCPGFFLKKEHAVTWRERIRNAYHGFGWCATAVREATLLRALRDAGVGCPEVAAVGEDGDRAFLLLRDEADMIELRAMLPTITGDDDRRRLAEALGHELARMHEAGFNHPDLFAKHILVKREGVTFRFCLLDWARGRQLGVVPWRLRCRDLAALDATLHPVLANTRLRLHCLHAYLHALTNPRPLARLARHIRGAADVLRRKRQIRDSGQLPTPAKEQQFVQLHQGRLLVVRSHYEELEGRLPDEWLREIKNHPPGNWELPRLAHTLFRLHRFGIEAPRLLAVSRASLHTTLLATIPLEDVLRRVPGVTGAHLLWQADAIVRQVHAAGYRLPAGESWPRWLGVDTETATVMLTDVEPLVDNSADWHPHAHDRQWMLSLAQQRERQVA